MKRTALLAACLLVTGVSQAAIITAHGTGTITQTSTTLGYLPPAAIGDAFSFDFTYDTTPYISATDPLTHTTTYAYNLISATFAYDNHQYVQDYSSPSQDVNSQFAVQNNGFSGFNDFNPSTLTDKFTLDAKHYDLSPNLDLQKVSFELNETLPVTSQPPTLPDLLTSTDLPTAFLDLAKATTKNTITFSKGTLALNNPGFPVPVFDSITGTFGSLTFTDATPVPLPAAAWLFGSAFVVLAGLKKRRKAFVATAA
jgi:hypothetical protein